MDGIGYILESINFQDLEKNLKILSLYCTYQSKNDGDTAFWIKCE